MNQIQIIKAIGNNPSSLEYVTCVANRDTQAENVLKEERMPEIFLLTGNNVSTIPKWKILPLYLVCNYYLR